ncbi:MULTISPECIES: plasmid partitioning protein RepB C-terminal domain-containing protein [unclassified Mesorhizobium]|uniref:plasmid partitioning protein RepB C-terminal domain-containing protein n=2 Tax=Mesorhizobium TaxID=68287 RepID=UPI000FCCDF12|nr:MULTISPECIES: plasmid partitioning protein RepB C-terminal domain-containing protein [unclassified Mesorhizobium]RUX09316.1 hypothetical protein EOA30_03995 [Mesorhizobium sp. M8A.F.Ca.ET.059.01.1.1]RUW46737.1 hypothetical protein EOA36_24760 [Mesorhizobium sp. M8A.F.Ca.ET.021.01.1.1]TGP95464.1 hypothetical protein EN861_11165 [Mesorhizobium sp. M8A.F.Ca.ET.218.01.1.1]TGT18520.1 hypothetical protein EN856_11180 [Mesorhizobium sp. M8A.F.Ca.ET.213.01.1.1]TGT89536.1 hypothetical protein EN804_
MTQAVKISRHTVDLISDLQGPQKLYSYQLRATYDCQCERMRLFIREANASQAGLETIAAHFGKLTTVNAFRALMEAERLGSLPMRLAERIRGNRAPIGDEKPTSVINRQLVAGICLDALELLEDGPVPAGIFCLLRKVVPSRQIEITRLMIGLDRVRLHWARVLVALTPQTQLAAPSVSRMQFAGIDASDIAAMEIELAALSLDFLNAAEHLGPWGLELVAARGYLNRLMDNAPVVRYLARNFPATLSEFQKMIDPASLSLATTLTRWR